MKDKWASKNRDRINAKRRARRLVGRKERLGDKTCIACEILLVERLEIDGGRTALYCRKCLTEYRAQTRRHRWRRYYYRKRGIKPTTVQIHMLGRKRRSDTKV